jgi:hypothetical protein
LTRKDYVDQKIADLIAARTQAGSLAATFTASNQANGTVTFAAGFTAAPKVTLGAEVPTASSIDLVPVIVGPVTTSGFTWRVRERGANSITLAAILHWTATAA